MAQPSYTPCRPEELKFEQGSEGERFPYGTEPQMQASVSLNTDQVCSPRPTLEIIFFSKIHLVTPEGYIESAAGYHQMLRKDLLIQLDAVTSNRRYWEEWDHPKNWAEKGTAWAVEVGEDAAEAYRRFFHNLKNAPKPSVTEFDALIKRLNDTGKIIDSTSKSLAYSELHQLGIELAMIREDFNRLMKVVRGFQNRTIDTAETMAKGLETVEGASFQVLALVPTLTMMDPLREAAYRTGLVITRATARGIGGAIANSTVHGMLSEVFGVLKADVPGLITDILGGRFNAVLTSSGMTGLRREVLTTFVRQQIEFFADLTMMIYQKKGQLTQDDLLQLGEMRLVSIVGAILSTAFGGRPEDPRWQKLAKSLVENTCNSVFQDLMTARDTAKAQNREVWDVFLSEFPSTLVKILQGTIMGVLQRNAATIQNRAAVEGQHYARSMEQARENLKQQKASTIYNTDKIERLSDDHLRRNTYPPLKEMEDYEHYQWLKAMNLHPDLASGLRRYAHDMEQVIAFRIPNEEYLVYWTCFSMRPKPLPVKAKSLDYGPLAGLVAKPFRNPSTHKPERMQKALDTWTEHYVHMAHEGMIVRQDGLVFHPDMLLDHARMHPEDKAAAEQAHAFLLKAVSGKPALADMNDALVHETLRQEYGSEYEQAASLLKRVKMGYYSDIDLAEVVDAKTGNRNAMGSGGETGSELAYLQRNRDNLDRAINVQHDIDNIPPEFRGPDGKARVSATQKTPYYWAVIQHGGDYEFNGKGEGGKVGMIFPGGRYVVVENREQYEAELRKFLGPDRYKTGEQRALNVRKNSLSDPTNFAEANGQGQRISTAQAMTVQQYYRSATQDLPGTGDAVPHVDVLGSLIHRGLSVGERDLAKVRAFTSLKQILDAIRSSKVIPAVDLEAQNIVLAVTANAGIADGLDRLAQAIKELQLDACSQKVWLELYTSDRPVTADYITGRMGPSQPSIDCLSGKGGVVTTASPKGNQRHYAFRVDGMQPTFSPKIRKADDRGAVGRDKTERRKDLRDAHLSSVARNRQVYGSMVGWKLMDVWEDQTRKKLTYTPVTVYKHPVAVFASGMVSLPEGSELHDDITADLMREALAS